MMVQGQRDPSQGKTVNFKKLLAESWFWKEQNSMCREPYSFWYTCWLFGVLYSISCVLHFHNNNNNNSSSSSSWLRIPWPPAWRPSSPTASLMPCEPWIQTDRVPGWFCLSILFQGERIVEIPKFVFIKNDPLEFWNGMQLAIQHNVHDLF